MNVVDILIHIKSKLDDHKRSVLVSELRTQSGVIAPRFVPNKKHLLIVAYNPGMTNTGSLISKITGLGVEASLVGM